VLLLVAACAAVGATLAFVNAISKTAWTTGSLPSAGAAPSPSSAVTQANSPYPSDARGFVNSNARCDGSLSMVALVRTAGSLVAICADDKNNYTYHGVRLSDGSTLNIPAQATNAREFVAHNEGVDYEVGTEQLVITIGLTLVRRENVIEYREPKTFSAEAPPTSSPAPSAQRPPS
jgi:hypothetical protein